MATEPDLGALLTGVRQLTDLIPAMIEKLTVDTQVVAIAEAEGDLAGAWAIALPWMKALARVQRDNAGQGSEGQ